MSDGPILSIDISESVENGPLVVVCTVETWKLILLLLVFLVSMPVGDLELASAWAERPKAT